MISVNLSIELDGRQNSFKTNILQGYRMKMNQSIKLKGEAPKTLSRLMPHHDTFT